LPGQHFSPVVPQVVQRAETDVAVEVEVDEQKLFGPVQILSAQHGPPVVPHKVQVPALVA
jgi:hypothetical protein